MWDDLVHRLKDYPTAVLTVTDSAGHSFSIRCTPEPDESRQVLRVTVPSYVDAQAGPAGLLCHFHDDELWQLKNFIALGELEADGNGWVFRAERVIEGAGAAMRAVRQIREGRRTGQRYLDRRGLDWPEVPWAKLRQIYERAQRTGRST